MIKSNNQKGADNDPVPHGPAPFPDIQFFGNSHYHAAPQPPNGMGMVRYFYPDIETSVFIRRQEVCFRIPLRFVLPRVRGGRPHPAYKGPVYKKAVGCRDKSDPKGQPSLRRVRNPHQFSVGSMTPPVHNVPVPSRRNVEEHRTRKLPFPSQKSARVQFPSAVKSNDRAVFHLPAGHFPYRSCLLRGHYRACIYNKEEEK